MQDSYLGQFSESQGKDLLIAHRAHLLAPGLGDVLVGEAELALVGAALRPLVLLRDQQLAVHAPPG